MPIEASTITEWIPQHARVLDLACGDGLLLEYLSNTKQAHGYGLENDAEQIAKCIQRGVNVIEKTLDKELEDFSDQSFDTVIMTQALQVMKHPDIILDEMLRVGKECIVTFPNFGNWRTRCYLMGVGRMPVTKKLPYQWYDTPNIHFCTVVDFEELCKQQGYQIIDKAMMAEQPINRQLKDRWPNLFAETAIYHLTRR